MMVFVLGTNIVELALRGRANILNAFKVFSLKLNINVQRFKELGIIDNPLRFKANLIITDNFT